MAINTHVTKNGINGRPNSIRDVRHVLVTSTNIGSLRDVFGQEQRMADAHAFQPDPPNTDVVFRRVASAGGMKRATSSAPSDRP